MYIILKITIQIEKKTIVDAKVAIILFIYKLIDLLLIG